MQRETVTATLAAVRDELDAERARGHQAAEAHRAALEATRAQVPVCAARPTADLSNLCAGAGGAMLCSIHPLMHSVL